MIINLRRKQCYDGNGNFTEKLQFFRPDKIVGITPSDSGEWIDVEVVGELEPDRVEGC